MDKNRFVKSHGLGNEYLVFDRDNITFELNKKAITRICNVNFGIGSDGILINMGLLDRTTENADIGLKIFNPDGSKAEVSGNGLRIFCKYAFDYGIITKRDFIVKIWPRKFKRKPLLRQCKIDELENGKASLMTVDMGFPEFRCDAIPVISEYEISQNEIFYIKGKRKPVEINCVSIGNPHCTIIKEIEGKRELFNRPNIVREIKKYGPIIEKSKNKFPDKINIQYARVVNREEVEILIWERGAGFTLASGSSSCAVASILRKLDRINENVNIRMKGGELKIAIDKDGRISMTGEVKQICEGVLNDELINELH
ncbi:MAG: diaminopimelate epimerase [Lentimicrobiaceae bacterium]|jgi:diaminopimelate epimerase